MSKSTWYEFKAYDTFTKKMWGWAAHNAFSTERGSIRDWFRDSDLEPMLFTGVYDRNETKISEWDVVEVRTKADDRLVDTITVEYMPEYAAFNLVSWLMSKDFKSKNEYEFVVVGNKFQGVESGDS